MAKETSGILFSTEEMNNMIKDSLQFQQDKPVVCFGREFSNDQARREYYREELRKKLPELRKIEGFPIGEDDDIINLSDPPYYTACPNPWLNDFIAEWEQQKEQLQAEGKRKADFEVKEPYAADISDIKNDSVYRAHTYHTKVPHTVVMRYLLHYTQPGDIVLDGFAGTGMTGLACQTCDNPSNEIAQKVLMDIPSSTKVMWGRRHGICSDLSPYASLISYNYNTPINSYQVEMEINSILNQMNEEFSWMYSTKHSDGNMAVVKCYIWSEIGICENCGDNIVLWDNLVNKETKTLSDHIVCTHCGYKTLASKASRVMESDYDTLLDSSVSTMKYELVRVVYEYKGKRYEKKADAYDHEIVTRINNLNYTNFIPVYKLPNGYNTQQPMRTQGYHYVHQFYTKRNLMVLSAFYDKIQKSKIPNKLKFVFTGMINRSTKMNRVHFTKYLNGKTDWDAGHLKGTLYIPSFPVESSVLAQISNKLNRYIKAAPHLPRIFDNALSVNSAVTIPIKDASIDYIFVDPPFGANIMYSELNFLAESWLKVLSNNLTEAIVNEVQGKNPNTYKELMTNCFKEFFRILKPGKWITIEFSNTSASIWNSIQQSLSSSGFIVANVSALNKGQGGIRSITSTTAVKQDLAISCYKPSNELIKKIDFNYSNTGNVWDFITEHLDHLPIHIALANTTTSIIERSPKILYDRLISYYVQHGYPIPMNAKDFQKGLEERYVEKDGMIFTPIQAAEYEEKKKSAPEFVPLGIIVSDESNGIQWLRNLLRDSPKTYQEIQPEWMQAINGLRKGDILPELKQLLEENFIEIEGGKWRLPNMQDDVDKDAMRTKSLLREFKIYSDAAAKPKAKIKEVRVEALRTGFKQCYIDKDFHTIVQVGDKIPQNLLEEDDVLLQFYEIALNKV